MKGIGSVTVKIKTDISLLTIIKWRLLGFHKKKIHSILPDGYEAKNGRLFRIETDFGGDKDEI